MKILIYWYLFYTLYNIDLSIPSDKLLPTQTTLRKFYLTPLLVDRRDQIDLIWKFLHYTGA